MEYSVKELAELSGVSPRTLRWYDQKGLLQPARRTGADYRVYGQDEVSRLQQILFYRELGLPLDQIRAILNSPDFDRQAALQSHLAELTKRRDRLDALILTVQNTLIEEQGGTKMSDREKFEAFKADALRENEEKYGPEIREKYGDVAVETTNAQIMGMTETQYDDWRQCGADLQALLEQAVLSGTAPNGPEGLRIAELHKKWLSFTMPKYDPRQHAGIAQLYVSDTRFAAQYDRTVPGCAQFLRDAVAAYTVNG